MGLTFLHPDTNESDFLFPIPILTHMRHLHYVRVGCCNWSHADSRIFPFVSASSLCKHQPITKNSIARSCRASFRVLPFEVLRESVSPSLFFFFSQLIAERDAQFCMHLFVEIYELFPCETAYQVKSQKKFQNFF